MGKDKVTYQEICNKKEAFYKEIADRCLEDCISVLSKGGLQNDLYKECWLKGFEYAGERIQRIFELSKKEQTNEKAKN